MKEKQLRVKAEQERDQYKFKVSQLLSQLRKKLKNQASALGACPSGNYESSLHLEDQLPEIARMDTQPEKRKKTEDILHEDATQDIDEHIMPEGFPTDVTQGEEEEKKGIHVSKSKKKSQQQIHDCKVCDLKFKNKKARQKHNKTLEHLEAQILLEASIKAEKEIKEFN